MIKTWQQRCEEHPDHDGIVSDGMIQARMQEEIDELRTKRQWKGLTAEDVKAPIQRAMQHFGYDPTQYSLGGLSTIGFYGLVKDIEARLKEKNG